MRTACSGSDVVIVVCEELMMFWKEEFGVDISLRHVFACESNKRIQQFLLHQFPDCEDVLVDTSHLGLDFAPTALGLTGKFCKLTRVMIYVAGFVCKARSKLNSSRHLNVGCVQAGSQKTGKSFSEVGDYVEKQRPPACVLENVPDLGQASEGMVSDSDYIVQWFQARNYSCAAIRIEASEFGSVARRERDYYVSFLNYVDNDPRLARVQAIVDSIRIPEVSPLVDYLLPDQCHQVRCKEAVAEEEAREYKYKEDHMRLFDLIKEEWPPVTGQHGSTLDHMSPRAYEVL
jgi:site-specific DNA-cytosine methylase